MQKQDIQKRIDRITKDIGGRWGIYANDLAKKRVFAFNEDQVFETMSVIKLPILVYLLKEVDNGKFNLDWEVIIKRKQISKGSGILQSFSKNPKIKLYDLALLMIIVSDNTATNVLIDLLGRNNINNFIKKIGLAKTELTTDKLHFPLNDRKLGLGKTTPYEMATLIEGIVKNKFLSRKSSKIVIDMMRAQEYLKIPRYLPYQTTLGTTKSKIKVVASKGGANYYMKDNHWSVLNDVGYIKNKINNREYVFSIFSEGKADTKHLWTSDNKYSITISKVSKALYQYFESYYVK